MADRVFAPYEKWFVVGAAGAGTAVNAIVQTHVDPGYVVVGVQLAIDDPTGVGGPIFGELSFVDSQSGLLIVVIDQGVIRSGGGASSDHLAWSGRWYSGAGRGIETKALAVNMTPQATTCVLTVTVWLPEAKV